MSAKSNNVIVEIRHDFYSKWGWGAGSEMPENSWFCGDYPILLSEQNLETHAKFPFGPTSGVKSSVLKPYQCF